jgi:hypothetical protein
MLINLSNHPSSQWGEAQFSAAQNQFGDIVDVAFPQVPANATSADVLLLAKLVLGEILALNEGVHHIHVMGEMSFVFAFVKLAQQKGLTCWVSCTERLAEEKDGKKITTFVF